MSQIKFRALHKNQLVEVVAGWDVPLQFFHLTIYDMNDESIWCNLDYFDFDELKTTTPLKNALAKLNITPPDNFWDFVEKKEGNVIHRL